MNSKTAPSPARRNPRRTILVRDLAPRAEVLGRGATRIFGEADDPRDVDERLGGDERPRSSGNAIKKKRQK